MTDLDREIRISIERDGNQAVTAVGLAHRMLSDDVGPARLELNERRLMRQCPTRDAVMVRRDDKEPDTTGLQVFDRSLEQHSLGALDVHHQQRNALEATSPHE